LKIDLDSLKDRMKPLVEESGFELAEVASLVAGGRQILRVYIFSPAGVTLDDCAVVSREISDLLDTQDLVSGRYTLEISSLGLDRPLVTSRDFQRRSGERVRITYDDGGKKRIAQGILKGCDGIIIRIENEETTISIPVDANPRGKILL
jgi:ribosome maturation factor RimP